jgi:phosphoribosylanthranilate isomerase
MGSTYVAKNAARKFRNRYTPPVPTRVKICGITRVEDALCAEDAGADAIGFIFVPDTKRFITPERAGSISRGLGAFTTRVGVFRDTPLETVLEAVQVAQLGAVQLHGYQSEALVEISQHVPVIRAVSFQAGMNLPEAQTLHVDGLEPGSGQAFDWAALDVLSLQGRRWVLAGGLNPANVGDAIRALKPWGVDVSSGVEAAPGVKDHEKIRAFVNAARE